jgi:hypothetical protein
MQKLGELVERLPPDMIQEVQDFIEFLLEKRAIRPKGKPEFGWAGALRDMREQYSSVELEREIEGWRIEQEIGRVDEK